MRTVTRLLLICSHLQLALLLAAGAHAQQAGAVHAVKEGFVHAVTYIEVLPSAADRARDLLAAHAEASRGRDGNLSFLALRRIGRANHFAILETWADRRALEAYGSSRVTQRFRADLDALAYSPPDRREHSDLLTGRGGDPGSAAVHVLTHVDVFPSNTETAVELLRELAASSRAESGNVRFDVLVSERANHMTMVEIWRGAPAHDAHLGATHTRRFRDALAPLSGALYDERLYRGL